jgi:PAP_fibrillin
LCLSLRRIPTPFRQEKVGYVDWLYLDEDLRITRGNKGSVFIHTRETEA